MRNEERKCPHSENVKCLQDEDLFVHVSAPPSTPCLSHWHTAIAPNQPITAGFCLRGLIGWLTKLINTPPGATSNAHTHTHTVTRVSTYTMCKLLRVSCRVCVCVHICIIYACICYLLCISKSVWATCLQFHKVWNIKSWTVLPP